MRSLRAGDSAKTRSCGEERLWRMRMRTRNPKRPRTVPRCREARSRRELQTARGLNFARLKVAAANGRASVRAFVRNAVWLGCDAFAIWNISDKPPSPMPKGQTWSLRSAHALSRTRRLPRARAQRRARKDRKPLRAMWPLRNAQRASAGEDGCSDTKLRTRERNDESDRRYAQLRLHDGALSIPCISLAGAADARLWRRILAFLA